MTSLARPVDFRNALRMVFEPQSRYQDIRAMLDSYAVEVVRSGKILYCAPLQFCSMEAYEPPPIVDITITAMGDRGDHAVRTKQRKGTAAMDPEKARKISRKGGAARGKAGLGISFPGSKSFHDENAKTDYTRRIPPPRPGGQSSIGRRRH